MPHDHMDWEHWWGMGWMWLIGIAVVIALVVVIAVIVRSATGREPPARERSSEDLLKERYARGEIEREEYERRLSDLRR